MHRINLYTVKWFPMVVLATNVNECVLQRRPAAATATQPVLFHGWGCRPSSWHRLSPFSINWRNRSIYIRLLIHHEHDIYGFVSILFCFYSVLMLCFQYSFYISFGMLRLHVFICLAWHWLCHGLLMFIWIFNWNISIIFSVMSYSLLYYKQFSSTVLRKLHI